MNRFSPRQIMLAIAAFAAIVFSAAQPTPASAAPLTPGVATSVKGGLVEAQPVYYVYRRRYYRRPVYYRRPIYRRPVYYGRRCWVRPQVVMTPWGYRRRMVRVCR